MFKILHQQKYMHSAHLKLRGWGVGELSVSYVIERIIPRGVPKHTSSFYLDKYRFAAGDHDLELRERERESQDAMFHFEVCH